VLVGNAEERGNFRAAVTRLRKRTDLAGLRGQTLNDLLRRLPLLH
jgi:hypothetical protein